MLWKRRLAFIINSNSNKKKKSVNTLYHHILFLTFVNIVSKLQIIYPTSNETKPNKNKNIFIFYFLPFKILPTLKKYVCVEGFIA